jgi:hypothetical protein
MMMTNSAMEALEDEWLAADIRTTDAVETHLKQQREAYPSDDSDPSHSDATTSPPPPPLEEPDSPLPLDEDLIPLLPSPLPYETWTSDMRRWFHEHNPEGPAETSRESELRWEIKVLVQKGDVQGAINALRQTRDIRARWKERQEQVAAQADPAEKGKETPPAWTKEEMEAFLHADTEDDGTWCHPKWEDSDEAFKLMMYDDPAANEPSYEDVEPGDIDDGYPTAEEWQQMYDADAIYAPEEDRASE